MTQQIVGIQKTGALEALSDRIRGSVGKVSNDFTLLFDEISQQRKSKSNAKEKDSLHFFESPRGFAIVLGEVKNAPELQKAHGASSVEPADLIFFLCEKGGTGCFQHVKGDVLAIVHVKKVKEDGSATYIYRSSECLTPFYWIKSKPFAFATRLKDLICLGEHTPRLDHVGIAAYLHLGFFPMYLTPFFNIDKLTAGFVLTKTDHGYHALPAKKISKLQRGSKKDALAKRAAVSIDKAPPFSWKQAAKDIWDGDLPTSLIAYPYLLHERLGLKLRPLHPNKPIRQVVKKRPFWKGLVTNFPPFSYLLLMRANPYPSALKEYQKDYAIFTRKELMHLSPFTYTGFDLPSFMRKIFSQTLKRDFSPETFFEHEARNISHLFDGNAKKKVSLRQVLAEEEWVDRYINDKVAKECLELLRAGALKDQDIIDPRWMKNHSKNLTPRIKRQLWSLATLEVWLQLFFEEAPTLERLENVQKCLEERFEEKELALA